MADIVSAKIDVREVKARLKVATVCVHIVAWLPMSMDRKHRAADWLLDWAMKPGVKVKTG